MSGTGFVLSALAVGLGSLSLRPQRGFFPLTAGKQIVTQVTIEEKHTDDMEITDHPVEFGAPISDHAYMRPREVIITCGFSNSPGSNSGVLGSALQSGVGLLATKVGTLGKAVTGTAQTAQSLLSGNSSSQVKAVYQDFLDAQSGRALFKIMTGKRVYTNMMIKSLSSETNDKTENSLILTVVCREVIIARTRIIDTTINKDAQSMPAKTNPLSDLGQKALVQVSKVVTPFVQVTRL